MKSSRKTMRLAYLVTYYPAISHTFIRREIRELERRGHFVLRLAVRRLPRPLVDPLDEEEQTKTLQCLEVPLVRLLVGQLRTIAIRPLAFLRTLGLALQMGWRSDRGVLRHMAYLVQACYLTDVLRRNAIEHLHAHFAINAAAVARLIRQLGGPGYSFTVHGIDLFDAPESLDIRGKVADARFVVAVCDYAAAQLRRWIDLEDWPKIHVVRCSVAGGFLDEECPVDATSETLVCVGRLSPEKGQVLLIDALARLVLAGEDAKLVLVGDGAFRPVIERRIRDTRLEKRVEITGHVSEAEVCRRILAGRALVLASFAEGLPVVIMEAFALGRPVISTYVAGIPELVRSGENGWLVPAGNVEELASAMREALRTPVARLQAMGASGRERVRQRHQLQTEAAKLEALLMNGGRSDKGIRRHGRGCRKCHTASSGRPDGSVSIHEKRT